MEIRTARSYLSFLNWKEFIMLILWSIVLATVSFPNYDISYSIGIDPPLKWVFNHLISSTSIVKDHIIFPHGPLAFLVYPLKDKLLVTIIIKTLLQLFLVVQIFIISRISTRHPWIFTTAGSLILVYFAGMNLLVLVNIVIAGLIYLETGKGSFKLAGFILSAFAFYLNAYSAILAGIIMLCFLLINLFRKRDLLLFFRDSFIILGLIFAGWILIFRNSGGFINYFIGIINLAGDNSSAVSYYPDNNWLLLAVFIVFTLSLFIINRSDKAKRFSSLVLLSMFAAWKHGMAREDIYHVKGLFFYLLSLMVIYLIYVDRKRVMNLLLIITALTAFYFNMNNAVLYEPVKIEFGRYQNFVTLLHKKDSIIHATDSITLTNLRSNELPGRIKEIIDESAADVYPWDYSIIPVNGFNWQPRPVLHSYASYTSWLDKRNAAHFTSGLAPSYLIWDMDKITTDINGGTLESIDNRYLLNDEPSTIIEFIKNYYLQFRNNSFMIYKKRGLPLTCETKEITSTTTTWNRWTEIPDHQGDLLRAKIELQGTFRNRMKSFFYKDEETRAYLRTRDGDMYSWKIVPGNAADGLWIEPLILDPRNNRLEEKIEGIYFISSNPNIMRDSIRIVWESYNFSADGEKNEINKNHVLQFFSITKKDSVAEYVFDMETWSESFNSKVDTGSFSSTFSIRLDTLGHRKFFIETHCLVKASKKPDVNYVISIQTDAGVNVWDAIQVKDQLIDNNSWNLVKNHCNYLIDRPVPTLLKVYLWNTGEEEIYIDDFRIRMSSPSVPYIPN